MSESDSIFFVLPIPSTDQKHSINALLNSTKQRLLMNNQITSNENELEEMFQACSASVPDLNERMQSRETNEHYTLIVIIQKIDNFVLNKLLETNEILFGEPINGRINGRIERNALGKKFLKMMSYYLRVMEHVSASFIFTPAFTLFGDLLKKHVLRRFKMFYMDVEQSTEYLSTCVNHLNECVAEIRQEGNSLSFKESLRGHTKASMKNYRGAMELVESLLAKRSKLLVLRFDLSYFKQYSWGSLDQHAVTHSDIFKHRAEFINHLNKVFNADVFDGYIWKTEYKIKKSFHHHFVVFLNGQVLREAITISTMLGEHWNNHITNGRGIYMNLNAIYDDSNPICGINIVNHHDANKISNLKDKVVDYLCKPDYYIRLVCNDGSRWFGRSAIFKSNGVKVGRPRLLI